MSCTVQAVKAIDSSTYVISCTLSDSNGDAVSPNNLSWSLMDGNGAIINNREDVSVTPATTFDIVLYGDDIQQENGKYMYVTVNATYDSTYGTNLPLVAQTRVEICETVE